jgi:aspartyl-tRNA(Asn)/glutamyl-tRNA(Gln) amidotransferase subunit B
MNSLYIPTIGLEVHAELKTQTKMFCACKNNPDEEKPNWNICPVCMGHPGTLPVINKEAVKHILKVGVAVGGKLADKSEFDRKNYFYPDIPKGYQISQYKYPLVSGGELAGVLLTRIHLEEDTASSSHGENGYSLVNFNRAGVPLLELVTEPVIHSASEVVKFGEELQLLLQYLGVSDANMEKGEMRLEANISVSNTEKFGTKVEVKNLNSFRSAERAVLYEIDRHIKTIEAGGEIKQETRGWDEAKQETFSQRSKEDSHDYRYFPDPDLPKLALGDIREFSYESLTKDLKETPENRRKRILNDYAVKKEDVEFYIKNITYFDLFEKVSEKIDKKSYQLLSNYIISDIAGKNFTHINPANFAELILMLEKGEVSSRGAKDIIVIMYTKDESPKEIALREGLIQKNDEESLKTIVNKVISLNPEVIKEYKGGKLSALQFLVGQGMKESKGSANPQILKELFEKSL